jgi:hypothetical protein
MKIRYCFLIGTALAFVCVVAMLYWQSDVVPIPSQQKKMGVQTPASTDGTPAPTWKRAPSMDPVPRLKQGALQPSPELSEELTKRKELTPSGLPIDDIEVLDPEEVEKRTLAEQLAESLRNPAYLQSLDEDLSEGIEADSAEETEADIFEEVNAELLDADELADDQSEQEPDEEIDESALESDQSFTRPQMTASGVEISGHGYLDPEEVEKRLLAEQLAESLRNPAYRQSNPEEELLEEIEEEE